MYHQLVTLPTSEGYPFTILATRYYSKIASKGYTLIFLHATGMHKETWHITISHLFNLYPAIHEAYSIECPNHGQSAVINEKALKEHYNENAPAREYARAVHRFLTSFLDLAKRKLVAVAHSVGAPAIFLLNSIPFHTIIALEPGISFKNNPETNIATHALIAWSFLRQDTWKSRQAAKKDLVERSTMHSTWDERVLDLYVEYGLRSHPTSTLPYPFNFNGVTLSLSKESQAASFRSDDLVVTGLEAYTRATQNTPVHVVWGCVNDVGTPALQNILEDEEQGRRPASIRYIEDAGHLVVQQRPERVAEVIRDILWSMRSKL